jgi:hypothetical protein
MIQNFSASSVVAAAHATCIRKASCHCGVKSLLHSRPNCVVAERDWQTEVMICPHARWSFWDKL